MNTLNFFNINKVTNKFADFKNYLKLLSPEEQLHEINYMINDFNKSNCNGGNIAKKFRIIKELRIFKKEIMINHREHTHYD